MYGWVGDWLWVSVFGGVYGWMGMGVKIIILYTLNLQIANAYYVVCTEQFNQFESILNMYGLQITILSRTDHSLTTLLAASEVINI